MGRKAKKTGAKGVIIGKIDEMWQREMTAQKLS
jgi:hypothetical protein